MFNAIRQHSISRNAITYIFTIYVTASIWSCWSCGIHGFRIITEYVQTHV